MQQLVSEVDSIGKMLLSRHCQKMHQCLLIVICFCVANLQSHSTSIQRVSWWQHILYNYTIIRFKNTAFKWLTTMQKICDLQSQLFTIQMTNHTFRWIRCTMTKLKNRWLCCPSKLMTKIRKCSWECISLPSEVI